nr:MAG TPA: hypothetical protein [Caudoviricetes sp.]
MNGVGVTNLCEHNCKFRSHQRPSQCSSSCIRYRIPCSIR